MSYLFQRTWKAEPRKISIADSEDTSSDVSEEFQSEDENNAVDTDSDVNEMHHSCILNN